MNKLSARPVLRARWPLLLATALWLAAPAQAGEVQYRVQEGDTLIALGESLLRQPRDWVQLQRLNRVENPRRIPVGTLLRIPLALLRPEPLTAEVATVVGDARVDGRPVEAGTRIAAGAALATGADGQMTLTLPDGTQLMLPARSSAQIRTLQGYTGAEGQDFSLDLEDGRVESRVVPQRGPAARYRVDTPTAVIGVRGTEFRVGYDAASSTARAEVTEGVVGVAGAGRAAQARSPAGQAVSAGFGALARRGGEPTTAALPPAPSLAALPARFERPVIRFELPLDETATALRLRVMRAEGADDRHATHWGAPALFDAVLQPERGARRVEARIPGLADGLYRLSARTVAANGLEGYDAEQVFELHARPEPPFLSAPADTGKTGAGRVTLSWTQADDAAAYRVEVAGDAAFAQVVAREDGLAAPRYVADLAPGEYYWRVASIRADGRLGPFSDAARFSARAVPSLEGTTASVQGGELNFKWSGDAGQRFDYEFARDAGFTDLLAQGRSEVPQLAVPAPAPDTYWLRVRAIDADGFVGPWSAAQKLVVPASLPWWMLLTPLLML